MELKTENQIKRIVNNIVKVIKTGNSDLLTKQAYNYLYLCSGFIAHYNLHGFREHYSCVFLLQQNILDYKQANQYNNFHPGENDYDYYMQKAKIYNMICKEIEK